MGIKYIFIDESGDLGQDGSRYFTIAAIVFNNDKIPKRIIFHTRKRILNKKQKLASELKANKSNDRIREYVLKQIAKSDCSIFTIVVNKSKIFPQLYQVKEKLYNFVLGILVKNFNQDSNKLVIIIDKRSKNKLIGEDLKEYIISKFGDKKDNVELYQSDSYTSYGLQTADFVAWAIGRKFNTGDARYYNIISRKIVNKDNIELWKNVDPSQL